jgi:hypothetical protein
MELNASGGALTLDSVTTISSIHALFQAAHDINVNSSVISTEPENGAVTFKSHSGSVNLYNDSIQTGLLTVNSGDGILLSGTGQSYTTGGNGGTASFTAPKIITVNDANLSGFSTVNMAANTINIYNTAFAAGSPDNFGTKTGMATVNQSGNLSGELNLHGVSYGGTAINSTSQINFTIGPSTLAGINSYANPR